MEWELSLSQVRQIVYSHMAWCRSVVSSLVPATVFLSVFPFPAVSVVFSCPLGLPLPLCLPLILTSLFLLSFTYFLSPLTLLTSPFCTHIHSNCFFPLQTLVVFPAWLAADLVTSTPPKPTRARRFLLPFVFCSDSPPNGTLGSHWTFSGGVHPQNCGVAE